MSREPSEKGRAWYRDHKPEPTPSVYEAPYVLAALIMRAYDAGRMEARMAERYERIQLFAYTKAHLSARNGLPRPLCGAQEAYATTWYAAYHDAPLCKTCERIAAKEKADG